MSRRSWVIGIVLVGLIALALIILDGTPGGPIIVITPDPEPMGDSAKEPVTRYGTGWKMGCDLKGADGKDIDGIPYRFAHLATIDTAMYKEKNKPEASFSDLKFNVNGKTLEVHAEHDHVPTWMFDGKKLPGKLSIKMPEWPNKLIGQMTDLYIDGKAVKVEDLESINIAFHKHWLLTDCK